MTRFHLRAAAVCAAFASIGAASYAAADPQQPAPAAWIQKSDQNAELLLQVMARFAPEQAGFLGVDGLDEQVTTLPPDIDQQQLAAFNQAIATLKQRQAAETDPDVLQDIQILVDAAQQQVDGIQLNDKYLLPYFDMDHLSFLGLRTLLDDRVPAARRAAALVRLKKYAGLEPGTTPLTEQATAYIRAHLSNPALLGPYKGEIEKNLGNAQHFVDGIGQLFQKYQIAGYEPAYEALKKQLAAYDEFVKAEVLPRARQDFRLPAELYSYSLRQFGIDMSVDELTSRAKVAFREIQNEMAVLAPMVAKEHGWTLTDYRDVLHELKKDQLVGDAILTHYQGRIKDLEKIITEHHIVTLPKREMRIRVATEAEAADTPAPNMQAPRIVGNTGEIGEFVLPLHIPAQAGKEALTYDDFTFAAASWTLTAHEARPGHELQFAAMIEKGVSKARSLFAMNSTNVEGWALYQESEAKPYEPLDGQLVSLQHRLMRAARAILDPGLQLGQIQQDAAYRLLEEDVVLSHAMATQEVERYTFWAPGQAPSYFCGYSRLLEMRADAERTLGKAFDRQKFNDFIIAQGVLPPALLRKAVNEHFIPEAQKAH